MKMINVDYTSVVENESVRRGRSMCVSDEVARDLYGYEIDDGTEEDREYLEKMQEAINLLEELEGNVPNAIQAIG